MSWQSTIFPGFPIFLDLYSEKANNAIV